MVAEDATGGPYGGWQQQRVDGRAATGVADACRACQLYWRRAISSTPPRTIYYIPFSYSCFRTTYRLTRATSLLTCYNTASPFAPSCFAATCSLSAYLHATTCLPSRIHLLRSPAYHSIYFARPPLPVCRLAAFPYVRTVRRSHAAYLLPTTVRSPHLCYGALPMTAAF